MIGTIFGNYEITGKLGQGGMGAVYRARHLTLRRDAVVKSILSSFGPPLQEQLTVRFVREAQIQAQLDHPYIVRVLDFFTTSDNCYLVMEYVPGGSLRDLLERQGRLAPHQALELFCYGLSALEYAHAFKYPDDTGERQVGLTHRDIKPDNFLIDVEGRLKLTDFGIVKLAGKKQHKTQTGVNPGTVEYMSPEQAEGRPVDPRSDLYSMSVMLYEMLAGQVPFPITEGSSGYAVMRAHIESAPVPLSKVVPGIPEKLSDLVLRGLEKDVRARFQSAAEFLEAIQDYQGEAAPRVAPPPTLAVVPNSAPPQPMVRVVSEAESSPTIPAVAPESVLPQRSKVWRVVAASGVLVVLLMLGIGAFIQMKAPAAQTQQLPSGDLTPSVSKPAIDDVPPTPPVVTVPSAVVVVPNPGLAKARELLAKARALDEREDDFKEAIRLYAEYIETSPEPVDAGLRDHVDQLRKFWGEMRMGDFSLEKRDFDAAKQHFSEALKLRPHSLRAKVGHLKAQAGARQRGFKPQQ